MFLAQQGEWNLVSIHSSTVFFCRSLESNIEAFDDKEEGIGHHEDVHDPQANLHYDLNSQFDPNKHLSLQIESFHDVAQQLPDKVMVQTNLCMKKILMIFI